MNLTPEQIDICETYANLTPGQTLVVNANAGTGKTSTAVALISRIPSRESKRFVAFSKDIATELGTRLDGTGAEVKTVHALGFGTLMRGLGAKPKVEAAKYRMLIEAYKTNRPLSIDAEQELPAYLDMVRVTLTDFTDEDACYTMCLERDIDTEFFSALFAAGKVIIPWGMNGGDFRSGNRFAATEMIDFTDMLYVPYHFDLTPYQVDNLIVDECQDLSPAQLDLVLKSVKPTGRMLFVGDPNQAIFGFAGADHNSFQNIVTRTNATVLPLSICWRCPRLVLATVQDYVPSIKPAPNAPDGFVANLVIDHLLGNVKAKDMVLCRTTAPLISVAFEMIRAGIPCMVKGRAIGEGLMALIKKATKRKAYDFANLPEILLNYQSREILRLQGKVGSENALMTLTDRVDTLLCVLESGEITSEAELARYFDRLFGERASGQQVVLSTAHRAKGLEAHNVYLLCPELMPHPMAKSAAAQTQEHNLRYVAHTRAMSTLTLVDSGDRFKRKKKKEG